MKTSQTLFNQTKLKATQARLEITDILLKNPRPLSHQEILKKLPQNFDRVTLYRNLNWLLKNGLIHRISGEDRARYFEINHQFIQSNEKYRSSRKIAPDNHLHAHFNCQNCGKFFCLDDIHPKFKLELPPKFIFDTIELTVKGKCSRCQ